MEDIVANRKLGIILNVISRSHQRSGLSGKTGKTKLRDHYFKRFISAIDIS